MKKLIAFACAFTLVACAAVGPKPELSASAVLMPTKDSHVLGLVTLTQNSNHVLVSVDVKGLAPYSEHGFHIHEKGDCSSPDGMSAGGHFNPDGKSHGAHTSGQHHVGDLSSLKADSNGDAKLSFESASISLREGVSNVLGRGLIVHRDPDDFKTQPTGNSGPRLSCGVIVKIN